MRSSFLLRAAFLATALLGAGALTAHAQQIYRIVGPDGRVTYSDHAPAAAPAVPSPDTVRSNTPGAAENAPFVADEAPTAATGRKPTPIAELPYALRQIAQRFPVTLYTTKDCQPCAAARDLLVRRGVPFQEKTVETGADTDALRRISGDGSLPFATMGSQYLHGYSEAEWTDYLNAAGYPAQSTLPASYRAAAPEPLVAVQKIAKPRPALARPENSGDRPDASSASVGTDSTRIAPAAQPASSAKNPSGIQF